MKEEKKNEAKKKSKSKKLEEQIENLEEQLKRALADYQNLERRVIEEKTNSIRYANEELLKKILPAFDNLYLAEKYTEDEGIRLTIQNLTDSLEQSGVKKIEVLGKDFDPQTMECIDVVEGEKDKVISELKPGFTLHDKVIRPAQVKVGNGNIEE